MAKAKLSKKIMYVHNGRQCRVCAAGRDGGVPLCVPAVSSILSWLFMATSTNVNRPSVLNKTHKNTHT